MCAMSTHVSAIIPVIFVIFISHICFTKKKSHISRYEMRWFLNIVTVQNSVERKK